MARARFRPQFPNDRQQLEIVATAESCGYIFRESATGKGFSFRGYPPDTKITIGDDTRCAPSCPDRLSGPLFAPRSYSAPRCPGTSLTLSR